MSQPRSRAADALPPLVLVIASLAILAHLGAVTLHTLAAQSGPWPGPEGPNPAPPPLFAQSLDEQVMRGYLSPIRLTHNYHFAGNRILPGVFLEIQLKDSNKQLLMTVRLPDPEANAWLRHKQELFALGFVPDQPLPPPEGEVIPAPRQDVPRVPIWDVAGPLSLRLQRVQQHLIPRDRGPVYRPTEWSLVLARSYCRYLCRKHGAASAEIIRHSRDTIPPTEFLTRERPAGFTDLVANYGDLR